MNIEEYRIYCLSKPGTNESFPFDENVLVFKVMGKMFALTNVNAESFTINLKCDPERAIALRDEYEEVQPGYHMSKKHWNTLDMEGLLPAKLKLDLIDHSYELIVKSLTKAQKTELNGL